jgi:hypothetical protein
MRLCLPAVLVLASLALSGPWENPLMVARSSDGVTFTNPAVFQDSGGVPSAVPWRGDTLACVFQWCRAPVNGPTWDKVAVKFSYDRGATWTEPQLVVFNGLPQQYQRPFDPTLAVVGDSLRVYFSSSDGMPGPGGDSIINTYSAISGDGVNFRFEPGPRVDDPAHRLIDPAVIWFNNAWHYTSPIGAPQEGVYHYVSPDGLDFSRVPDIPSDAQHNWTGNFVVADSTELRFYGCGPSVWHNRSPDGGQWLGYTATSVRGGDPTVVRLASDDWLIAYVGLPYAGVRAEPERVRPGLHVSPNPTHGLAVIRLSALSTADFSLLALRDPSGRALPVSFDIRKSSFAIDLSPFPPGVYFLSAPGLAPVRVVRSPR